MYVAQDLPGATSDEKTRVFAASSGYWRPSGALDIYHFALVDVAGGNGAALTNGSIGVDARPIADLQITGAFNHVSTDLLQIAARTVLVDPDPTAIGVVQNDIAIYRISQDMARAAATVALAQRRFELSLGAGYRRRPGVSVALADGTGAVLFPESRAAEVTMRVLDRRSLGGTRIALSGTLSEPVGTSTTWSRGTIARASVGKTFAEQRGEIEADVMIEKFQDAGRGTACTALDPLSCYGTASTSGGQAGALATWRVAKEWLLIVDGHVGYQQSGSHYLVPMDAADPASPLVDLPVNWPRVLSVTGFVRVQWRYR